MEKELLNLTPKRFLCPYCGEWHEWNSRHELGDYDSSNYKACFECSNAPFGCNKGDYRIYFYEGYLYYTTERICQKANQYMDGKIPISSIRENPDEPIVTFDVEFTSNSDVGSYECRNCDRKNKCNCVHLGDKGDNRHMAITFGFEFEQSDYDNLAQSAILARKERELQERENNLQDREHALSIKEEELNQTKIEEEHKMTIDAKKGTSIKTLLYEGSPKENMAMLKNWAEKYKPVLKWAVPVAAVYGAYRILNSDEFDLSVNNVAETCEKNLGFKMECLENKKALKELMVLGGLSAGAYGAVQALSGLLGVNNEEKKISADVSVEEVETGMNQLQSISKKFSWLHPKTENMLPIALSVIMVYVTLHKPKFTGKLAKKVQVLTEDMQIRVGLYLDLAKDFIQDKFNIDLSDEEEQRRLKVCAFLLSLMGILAFLYGKKVLGDKSESEADDKKQKKEINKSVETFVTQAKTVVKKLTPTIYTYLLTLFASKKILVLEEEGGEDVVVEPEGEHQGEPVEGTVEQAETKDISEQQT